MVSYDWKIGIVIIFIFLFFIQIIGVVWYLKKRHPQAFLQHSDAFLDAPPDVPPDVFPDASLDAPSVIHHTLFTKYWPVATFIINMERFPKRNEATQKELLAIGIFNYQRFPAVDGKKVLKKDLHTEGFTLDAMDHLLPGEIGCAMSHVRLWKYIVQHKMGWTLVLEDDVIFHPNFKELFPLYLQEVPDDATIIYLGTGGNSLCDHPNKDQKIIKTGRYCTHAYMIDWKGAQYLLDHLLPFGKETFDLALRDHFLELGEKGTSYVFNGCVMVQGIRPGDFVNDNIGSFSGQGLAFQNRSVIKSTVREHENYSELD